MPFWEQPTPALADWEEPQARDQSKLKPSGCEPGGVIASITNDYAAAFRRRHQPRRPAPAKSKPGKPAPAMGPGAEAMFWIGVDNSPTDAAKSAALEAYEEAGVQGTIAAKALGTFSYAKRIDDDSGAPCKVRVFPLRVKRRLEAWPEARSRWLDPADAASLVEDDGLRTLINVFATKAA